MTDNNSHTSYSSSFPPSDWVETTLGEVCEITSSKRIFANEYQTSGIPFFRGKEVTEKFNGNNISTELFITEEKYNEIKNNFGVPEENDILLTSVGTLGNPYLVEKDLKFYFKDGNLTWFRKYKNISPKWLFYWIISPQGKEILSHAKIGSTQEAYTIAKLKNLEILLPPLPEQQAIASILSAFDDKIELLREQNKTLEEIGQTIFGEWFGKYGVDDELPEGWRVFELNELFTFVKGKKPIETSEIEQDEFIPQILIDTFNSGKTIFANPKNTVISNEDDLIMVMDGASSGRIEFGFSGIIGSTLALLKIEKPIKSILYYFLKSKEKDIQEKTTGSAIPHTDKNKVYNYEIVLPNAEVEMQKLDTVFSDFREKIIANRFQIQSLARSRDELLPRLMSGEVRVEMD